MGVYETRERAVSIMESWARDDSHGYDQTYRWGERGDYDCSAAVIDAWEKAGVPVRTAGAAYTGNMRDVFLRCGFEDVTRNVGLAGGSGLLRADVLLNHQRHTAMYCGNGQEVEASINELGSAAGGRPGDQTGREFLIRPYRNYPWDCVLRYMGGEDEPETPVKEVETCGVTIPTVRKGDTGAAVAALQAALKHLGYDPTWIDGEAGERTESAIRAFQKSRGLTADGVCGLETWTALLEG